MKESKLNLKSWQQKKLGDVCQFVGGGTPSKNEKSYWNGNIPWASIKDVKGAYLDETSDFITEKGVKNSATNIAAPGEVILATRITPGRPIISRINSAINQDLKIVRPKFNVDSKFLYYFFLNAERKIVELSSGTTVKGISLNILNEVDVSIPPLRTQRRIVAKIEELFSELDKGVEHLKAAQQQLKTYRQSLLNNLLSNDSYVTIESVLEKVDQGWSPKCLNQNSMDESIWCVIKTSAIQHGKFLDFENKILPKSLDPKTQHELHVGDILITRAGPRIRVGVCCLIRNTRKKLINCDKVYRLKVNKKIILPEYLEFVLNTPKYIKEIEQLKTGISDSGVNLTQSQFIKIKIPLPTKKVQFDIVNSSLTNLSSCDELEQTINDNLAQAEQMKQSILKQAFEGRLVKN